MNAKPKPRTEKTERQQDQRRLRRARVEVQQMRRRLEAPDLLPVRDDGDRYRP